MSSGGHDASRAAFSILFLAAAHAQTAPPQTGPPRFEVAAIRVSNSQELLGPSGIETRHGFVRATNVTVKRTIAGAYGIGEYRILGGPAWIESDRFQITAKAEQPVGDDVLNAMLQTLLAERFNLKLHRESHASDVLLLEIAKSGLKLQPANDAPLSCNNRHGHLEATSLSMARLAEILTRNLKLPVMDRTGLTGAYSVTLNWDANRPRTPDPEDAHRISGLKCRRPPRSSLA